MLALLSGLLAGSLHTLSGPDHLAAVLPLAAHAPARARLFGTFWGLGHGGGMLFWLLVGLSCRSAAPLARVSHWAELLVGFSLVLVGLWTLRSRTRERPGHHHSERAALGLGALHGTAGAGHLFAALPLLGLSVPDGVFYCLGFVISGVVSMAGAGLFMGRVAGRPSFTAHARPVCALITFVVGCAWIADALSV
ncbi:MAG: hypothetical protein QM778_37970 [Myxococcales bacterium]